MPRQATPETARQRFLGTAQASRRAPPPGARALQRYRARVRVIGGSARGRPLRAPRSAAVRPTSERVREAIFDVLGHLGAIAGAAVLDGFAGSGALGIEALSRGARTVTFVESDRSVVAALEENLRRTGFADHPGVRVVRGDVLTHLGVGGRHYDLVLLDPPYAFEDWARLLARVQAEVVVLESDRPIALPDHLALHRSYRYGTTLVTVAHGSRPGDAAEPAARTAVALEAPEPADAARKERS